MTDALSKHPKVILCIKIFIAILLWVVGCTVAGFIVAQLSGEHGSIIFASFRIAICVSGALAHTILLSISQFRHTSQLIQALTLWGLTLFVLLLAAVVANIYASHPVFSSLQEMVYV